MKYILAIFILVLALATPAQARPDIFAGKILWVDETGTQLRVQPFRPRHHGGMCKKGKPYGRMHGKMHGKKRPPVQVFFIGKRLPPFAKPGNVVRFLGRIAPPGPKYTRRFMAKKILAFPNIATDPTGVRDRIFKHCRSRQ